jgi:hypothetical protein
VTFPLQCKLLSSAANPGLRIGESDRKSALDQLTFGIDRRRRASRPCTFQKVSIAALCSLADALVRIGEYLADNGMMCNGPYQAARDLLMLAGPRVGGQALKKADQTILTAAMRIAPRLSGGVFPVQGPPGTGKTHIGARMICALAQSEKNWHHGQQPQGHS